MSTNNNIMVYIFFLYNCMGKIILCSAHDKRLKKAIIIITTTATGDPSI